MNNSVGDSICVSPPGEPNYTVPPFTATTTAAPSNTAAPVPPNIAPNTTTHCALYHLVEAGEYCNKLVVKYSISLPDFLFLNAHVNAKYVRDHPRHRIALTVWEIAHECSIFLSIFAYNIIASRSCTNLWAKASYCVKPVGPIDQYPSHPDYVSTTAYATVPYGSLPKATYIAPAITGLPEVLPLANRTRSDCFIYADGASLALPYDIKSSWFNSVCEALARGWSISLEQLANW